ncbi:MAG TPA: 23S rRNA (guanosine(2251)-2'-O)-methyltransferase RlmB [Rhizomicrobium sp.]|jgi:23S rRNA (guanosine2251-2'-O)-methyltransferase|nr:23S rRNA (guanosine(2251)-2'-O)-methyltransferase RlmB [Rhizomicrobium sp.]
MAKRHSKNGEALWLYGFHAVAGALANPRRHCRRCLLTRAAAEKIGVRALVRVRAEIVAPDQVTRVLPQGAVHQGVALACDPLTPMSLAEITALPERKIILILDQIADPHNVGAILRSAAAFDAAAVVVQERHAPSESGALAKAASGALDVVPYLSVVNIARTLEQLGEAGFWRVALTGDAGQSLAEAIVSRDLALVMGSEGTGIRRLVRERCDDSATIPISSRMESLNVSNAAAIVLYECRRVNR